MKIEPASGPQYCQTLIIGVARVPVSRNQLQNKTTRADCGGATVLGPRTWLQIDAYRL